MSTGNRVKTHREGIFEALGRAAPFKVNGEIIQNPLRSLVFFIAGRSVSQRRNRGCEAILPARDTVYVNHDVCHMNRMPFRDRGDRGFCFAEKLSTYANRPPYVLASRGVALP